MAKLKVRKDDKVLITKGKDRGRTGKVISVFPRGNRLMVEGVNLRKKSRRPRKSGEKGQIITIPVPFSLSNVKVICPRCGKASRLGRRREAGRASRFCKKCREIL